MTHLDLTQKKPGIAQDLPMNSAVIVYTDCDTVHLGIDQFK